MVAEETVAAGHVPEIDDGPFWLVDPLDGTKEFLSRNGEFTVNIALVEAREPVLGVVLAPARAQAWWGARGKARRRAMPEAGRAIAVRRPPAGGLVAIASRSHRDPETQAFLDQAGVAECISAGSSLKFCLVAEGKADLYPRFGRTMEWDVAAGHAVLAAAGAGSPRAMARLSSTASRASRTRRSSRVAAERDPAARTSPRRSSAAAATLSGDQRYQHRAASITGRRSLRPATARPCATRSCATD